MAAFLGFFGLFEALMRAGFGVAYRALPPVTISLQSLGSRLEDIQMAKTTSAGAPFPLLFG